MSGIKVFVEGKWYDSDTEPIFFIFEDDQSRKAVASHLTNMQPLPGARVYAQFPVQSITEEDFDRVCRDAKRRFLKPEHEHMTDRISAEQKALEIKEILDEVNGPWNSTI